MTYACQFKADGANAVFMMSTAVNSFERFLEMSREVRKNMKPETTLIANVGDQTLRNAGYSSVYHAVRLREGKDTGLSVRKRKQSISNFKEAGLEVGTCIKPVGPEHANEELAGMIEFIAPFNPSFSGAIRRIPIPGTAIGLYQ